MIPASPSISVLIPAYNAAAFLHRSVASALNQSLPPLEVLIVDDASTDTTLAVAQGLAAADARIRIIALPQNGGPSAARNAGIDAAQGDWLAILDADDRYTKDRLAQLAAIITANTEIVADNFVYYSLQQDKTFPSGIPVNDNPKVIDIYRFAAEARPYKNNADWGLLKPMFSRAFLNRHNLRYSVQSRHGEDFLFMLQALLAGGRFTLSHRVGYWYTDSYSGQSRTRIDYAGMAQQATATLADPRIASDRRLTLLLRQRVAAVTRLATARRFDQYRREHGLTGLLAALLTDWRLALETLRRLVGKGRAVAGRRG